MPQRKSICVFAGSSPGTDPDYTRAAAALAHVFVERDVRVVYGGASVGLMGTVADSCLERGGEVIGVIPAFLVEQEVAHRRLTDLRIVQSMHQRKQMMADLSDAFIALPGGIGTIEEFFEIFTWAQLGLHQKPFGLLNVCGFYTPLIDFLDHAVAARFVRPEHRAMLRVRDEPGLLLDELEAYIVPHVDKWIDRDTSQEPGPAKLGGRWIA